ncbi:hypothetical protein [Streptomyces sp. NPDC001404]|uniref:hypothetical protein n=1 Tax=Streptomyces sp. NPDC001404 TaxID=3364571 RepID=UPI0036BE55AA
MLAPTAEMRLWRGMKAAMRRVASASSTPGPRLLRHWRRLLAWSVLSTTVMQLARQLERVPVAGWILKELFSAGWATATYLALPAMMAPALAGGAVAALLLVSAILVGTTVSGILRTVLYRDASAAV